METSAGAGLRRLVDDKRRFPLRRHIAGDKPQGTVFYRNAQVLAAYRHRIVVDANHFAGQLDFLPAAYVWRAVHDRVWLIVGRDQNTHAVFRDPLAHGCSYGDGIADFEALAHANDSGVLGAAVKMSGN